MFRNYLKIAFRSLWRSKVHSIINVAGLSIGISVCILIALFVSDEWTYDRFHSKADRIYRVHATENWGENQVFFNTTTPFPMGPTLKDNFPEVLNQVRINNIGTQVRVGENLFTEQVTIAGQDFFDVFDFELILGEQANALRNQSSVIITAQMAQKYFGLENPIGKPLSIQLGENFEEFIIKGVTKDVPTNSSIQFGILISDLNYPRLYQERVLTSGWFNINPETYVLLQEGVDPKSVEAKFPSLFKTILGEEEYTKSNYTPGLQPLTSIHLDTNFPAGIAPVSNPRYSYILAAIAILILIVGCINFVTLSVGRSLKRAKEVGIRKVVGAERAQLITQFIGEAVIVTLISIALGTLLALLGLPSFNDLSGKQLIFPFNGFLVLLLTFLLLVIGLIAGSYPAFVLSAFRPITILKGGVQSGSNRQALRKSLVGVQLVLSIFLISCTLIMKDQLSYLQNKDLGFNKEQLIVVPLNVSRQGRLTERVSAGFEKAEQFKSELFRFPGIAAATASSHDFGHGAWTDVGYTDDQSTYRSFKMNVVDNEYIPAMNMQLAKGRNFSEANSSDKRRSIIVNEAFARSYGWENAIGMRIPGKAFPDHEVIGVVKDFNFSSLYTKVEPLVLVENASIILQGIENINFDNSPIPKLIVRVKPEQVASSLDHIRKVWDNITGGEEFSFSFVDQSLTNQYRADQNMGKIVRIATLLAVLIGSLGLYGLASLAMQNRTKEISIRKVMGATERSLLILLSKEYIVMLVSCLLISVPLTVYLMQRWLTTFEYRVGIDWKLFALSGGVSLLIALATISYQTIKTANAQPAKTLKYE